MVLLPLPATFAPPIHQTDGYELPSGIERPVVSGRMVYFGAEGTVTAFDAATFRPKWRWAIPGPQTSVAVARGRDVYVHGASWRGGVARLAALDPTTGRMRWSLPSKGPGEALGLDERCVYASLDADRLSAIDAKTGRVRWTVAMPPHAKEDRTSEPNVIVALPAPGGEVVVAQSYERAFALDARTGRRLWTRRFQANPDASPIAIGGIVALTEGDGLTGVDLRTGARRWISAKADSGDGVAVFAGTFVALGAGRVSSVDPKNGAVRWTRTVGPSDTSGGGQYLQPINGRLVVGGIARTIGLTPAGSEAWAIPSSPSFGIPLWTDGRRTTSFGGSALYRYERGPEKPLPTGLSARRRLATAMAARFATLDPRNQERLQRLGEDAFPAVLNVFLKAGHAYDTGGHDGRLGPYRLVTDLAPVVDATASRKATPALIAAIKATPRGGFVGPYLVRTLGRVGDRDLATPLLIHLAYSSLPGKDARGVREAALASLVQSSHPLAVATMTRRMTDPNVPQEERDEIYRHLAGTGGAAGVRAVLAARTKRRLLEPVETRMDLEKMEKAGVSKLVAQRTGTDGRTWGLVQSVVLGSFGDLWLVERVDGRWTHPLFTGVSTAGTSGWVKNPPPEPRFGGKTAKELVGGAWFATLVGSPDLARDTDGDGLTDLMEARLGTDPAKADTDGDGDRDEIDPMPNAARRPLNDEEAVLAAIYEARYRSEGYAPAVLTMPKGTAPFEMVGWNAPVIWAAEDSEARFALPLERCYEQGVGLIRFHGEDDGAPTVRFDAKRTVATVTISTYFGGLNGTGYTAVARKFGDEWVVVEMRMAYIS